MYEAMDPTMYRYIVALRDSRGRYLSHYRHVIWESDWEGSFETWWKGQPDNYAVRKICGTRCSSVPKFQISPELLNYTLKRLDLCDDLLFVEDFEESYRRFARSVEWTTVTKVPNDNRREPANNSALDDFDPLMSTLDDALYHYARQKYEGVTNPTLAAEHVDALSIYFAEGKRRKCTSECACPGSMICSQFR